MSPRSERALAVYYRWRFLVLLCALVLLLCGQPIFSGRDYSLTLFDAFFGLVVAAAILSHAEVRTLRWIGGAVGGAAVLLTFAGHALASPGDRTLVSSGLLLGAAFLIFSAILTAWAALRRGEITLDSLFGAVCGYLLLGVAWAVLYSMIDYAHADAFHVSPVLAERVVNPGERMTMFIYFSFVTLATLGYGDITPLTASARTLSWLEAVVGQLYLAVLVAGLVGALITRGQERRHEN